MWDLCHGLQPAYFYNCTISVLKPSIKIRLTLTQRLCMHILNFSAAYTICTAPAMLNKRRQTCKQQGMSSSAARSITCYSKIPEFLVGTIGQPMPAVGLGTASHPFVAEDVRTAVLTALELGYRHIDTAALYASERVVGEAMAEAMRHGVVVSREELFVTSKVWCTQCHPELVLPSLKESLMNLQMEYVDLYLIHWPMAIKPSKPHFPMKREDIVPMDLSGVWQAMEECHRLGLTKMIGVSNFTTKKLQELLAIAKIPPAVNQVELNPTWQQKKLIEFCNDKGIHVAAYSPLGGQRISKMNPVRQSDILEEIGKARGKSVAQISLRWIYEQGANMVAKSLKRERLKENLEIFDWELSDEDRFKIGQIAQRKLVTVHNLLCPEGISGVDISDVDVLEI